MSKEKIAISFMLALLFLGGVYLFFNKTNIKKVKVSKVELNDLSSSLTYPGVVFPKEIIPVYIEAPALIESILVRVGQEVNLGDSLMIFSSKSIIENDKELKINELDIKNIKLRIADLESGSLKLELDSKKLNIKDLEEKIKADERKMQVLMSETKSLKSREQTYKKIFRAGGISSIELNRITNEADKKLLELEELKSALDLNRQKFELSSISLESLKRQLEIENAQLKSNLEKLQMINDILIRQSKQLKKPLEAPIDGVITFLDVTEGSNMQSGQRLLAISPKGKNLIKIEVPTYASKNILKGQKALIKSLSSEENLFYNGIVSRVSNIARDSSFGTKSDKVIEVEILISETNDLKPGFITDVEITNRGKNKVPTISAFSVLEDGNKNYVYVVEEGEVKRKEITIGLKTPVNYEVLNLPVGTEIITNPFKVVVGEKVKAVI